MTSETQPDAPTESREQPILHNVFSVRETMSAGTYRLHIDITDSFGERYEAEYISTPDDPYGLNPTIRKWLADNQGSYEVLPYQAPTLEQIRGQMPPLTARQLRLTLVRNGFSLSTIDAAIDALPAGQEKDEARIEWEYATTFDRLSATLITIASALGMSAEQIDTLWAQATTA